MKNLLILSFLFFLCTGFLSETAAQERFLADQTQSKKSFILVDDVLNTATIRLRDGRKIRLIGLIPLEKPPRKDPKRNEYNIIVEEDDPIIPFEQTALEFVTDLLKNKEVRLELDNLYRSSDGYILGYIFLRNGAFANAEILRQGFSDFHLAPQNKKYEKELRDAYREAKKEKRGLQGN